MNTQTPCSTRSLSPADLKGLSRTELKQLADELRAETINAVSTTAATWARALAWSS